MNHHPGADRLALLYFCLEFVPLTNRNLLKSCLVLGYLEHGLFIALAEERSDRERPPGCGPGDGVP